MKMVGTKATLTIGGTQISCRIGPYRIDDVIGGTVLQVKSWNFVPDGKIDGTGRPAPPSKADFDKAEDKSIE